MFGLGWVVQDSAEVRGVLLVAGEDVECGKAVFDFL